MTKKPSLASALQTQDEEEKGGGVAAAPANKQPRRSVGTPGKERPAATAGTREGKSNISGWFPDNVKFELEELRLELSRKAGRKITLQDVMGEAYNDLFKKYGRAELAPQGPR